MFVPRSEPSRQICDVALMRQPSPQTLCARRGPTAFLLAVPAEGTCCSERNAQVSISRPTPNTMDLIYTHPLPLSGVDSRGLSVAACYCGLTRSSDEDGGSSVSRHTPHEMDTPIAGLAPGVYFCIDPSKAVARTTASRLLSDFVQPLADPAGVWHVLDNGCGRTMICLFDPACLDQGLHLPLRGTAEPLRHQSPT